MTDDPRGAILQRDKQTYAIVPKTPVGMVSPEILDSISKVVRKYEIPITKITSGQRLALVGIKKEDIDPIWHDLNMDIGRALELCVHYVQACPGNSVCKFGVRDSLGLGMELEKIFQDMELPAKVKFGVSGCPFSCAESLLRDIGFIGKKKGWTMAVGGNAGGRPRIGDVIADSLGREEAIDFSRRFIKYYTENAKKRERTARFLERVGLEAVKKALA